MKGDSIDQSTPASHHLTEPEINITDKGKLTSYIGPDSGELGN